MSYCRFRNTLQDLQDCQDHIGDDVSELSTEEASARKRLIEICAEIASANADEDDDAFQDAYDNVEDDENEVN